MKSVFIFVVTAMLCSLQLHAQDDKPWLLRNLKKLGTFIDTLSARGIDHRYIEVPEKPWQLVLRYYMNDMSLTSYSQISAEQLRQKNINGEINWESRIEPRMSSSLGLWAGYRGYGLGYSYSITHSTGRHFTIGATGSNFGINLRTRKFSTSELSARMWGYDDEETIDEDADVELFDPVSIRTTIFDAYYMFNGKRFSYAAAYDQSVIQRRSAGSLMLGVMWYAITTDYVSRQNALFIQMLGDVGKIRIHEGSIGVGYAYNWVPTRNLLVNVTALPLLSVYNRAKVYLYDSNYDIFLEEGEVSPTGKKYIPDDFSWLDDITITEIGTAVRHPSVSLNLDARVSVTYNLNNCFVNVYGQLNHFRNSVENSRLRMSDWYIYASLGYRF